MKQKPLALFGLLFSILTSAGGAAEADRQPPPIDIEGVVAPMPLAIVPFEIEGRVDPKLQAQLHEIFQYDLEFSNYFQLLPNRGQIEEVERLDRKTGRINYASWRELDADGLIKGKIGQRGGGKIEIELRVYYCKGSYRIIGKRFSAERKYFRQLVHRLSDEVVFRLTGNPGIARSRIAFIYETLEKGKLTKELYLIDYDGHPDSLRRITYDRGIVLMPAWSPDGKEIAFTSYVKKNPDLFAVQLETGRRRTLSSFPGLNNSPTWPPSGKDLVLVLSKVGNSELYRLDLRGGRPTRLTFDRNIDSSPCYSPDGEKIVYTSDRGLTVKLYVMDAGGKNSKRISPNGGWYDMAAWAPWGDRLAFMGSQDSSRRFDLFTARSDGSDLRRLTRNAGSNESPCWSPDGRHILFTSNRDGNWNLYSMNRDGRNVRRITFLPGNCYSPDWSPVSKGR